MHNASLSCLALRVALRDVWNCKRFKKKKYYNVVNYCKLKLIKNYFWKVSIGSLKILELQYWRIYVNLFLGIIFTLCYLFYVFYIILYLFYIFVRLIFLRSLRLLQFDYSYEKNEE